MKLRVKLFAVAKELAGGEELAVDAPADATIAELRTIIGQQFPAMQRVLPHAAWAVDAQYASDDTQLTQDSDIALIPPVSGG